MICCARRLWNCFCWQFVACRWCQNCRCCCNVSGLILSNLTVQAEIAQAQMNVVLEQLQEEEARSDGLSLMMPSKQLWTHLDHRHVHYGFITGADSHLRRHATPRCSERIGPNKRNSRHISQMRYDTLPYVAPYFTTVYSQTSI